MKIIKKILLFTCTSILLINFSIWQWIQWWSKIPYERPTDTKSPTVSNEEVEDIGGWSKAASDKVLWIIKVPQPDNYSTSLSYVMALIQIAINWVLWLLSFVALIYMLYCGFLVFSSGSDDKNAQKGRKWIKTAAIALAWIGLSRLIISAIIWIINLIVWS